MGLFSTKSSSSSSNYTTQSTTTNVGGNSQYSQDFSELFGKSVINTGTYGEAARQSQTSTPYTSVSPTLSSTTTQKNDSSATSALGLGNPGEMIGAVMDGATGGVGSILGGALGAGIQSAFSKGSSSSSNDYAYYATPTATNSASSSTSGSSYIFPLLIGGIGVVAALFFL